MAERSSSLLGSKIGRTGDILRDTASSQIDEYQQRFSAVARFYDPLFKDLIVDKCDANQACKTALKLFGKETANFVAIDGTEYSKMLFDMIVFYAGAFSCEGTINFSSKDEEKEQKNNIKVNYQNRFLDQGRDISSCVPIYVNKVPEIDQTFFDLSQGQVNLMKPLSNEVILNNSSIANFLMTFAEIYLAYKFAVDEEKKTDVIFLDRSLSNMYSSLITDTSYRKLWDTNCSILDFKVDGVPIDVNDLTIARHNIINEYLDLPPARGDYLRYAILFNLLNEGQKEQQQIGSRWEKGQGLNFESICQLLGINNDDNANNNKKRKRVQRYIGKCVEEKECPRLASRYKSTWPRIKKLVTKIGDQIFYGDKEPFMLQKESADGSDSGSQYGSKDENKKKSKDKELITTLDLAFLTLFTLYMLIEECWKKNILLVGITKDSAAHDFKNHVIPICVCNDIWMGDDADDANKMTQDDLDNIPNTDRMLLQSISMFNHQKVSLPWALVEYDAAFVMAIPDFKKRKGYVSGAIRNKITPSQLFLRSFVQLEKAKQDNMLRSNVLSIDRLVYPVFDLAPLASDSTQRVTKEFLHEYGSDESIKFILFRNSKVRNDIQNLILNVLKGMCCPSVPETFGHNQALYIADKVAKWHNEQFGNMVDSTCALIFCDKGLRKFVFYMNTFRERRGVFESSRRTA